MVWYGMVWYGMVYLWVWYGYGMIWYGLISYGMVGYGIHPDRILNSLRCSRSRFYRATVPKSEDSLNTSIYRRRLYTNAIVKRSIIVT